MRRTVRIVYLLPALFFFYICNAQQPDPPGQVTQREKAANEAYLFAHMTHEDYGRLYYTVSLNGLYWHTLNRGKTEKYGTFIMNNTPGYLMVYP
ncbi:hypothetical protein [Sinomicrobium sp. M5D2P9]